MGDLFTDRELRTLITFYSNSRNSINQSCFRCDTQFTRMIAFTLKFDFIDADTVEHAHNLPGGEMKRWSKGYDLPEDSLRADVQKLIGMNIQKLIDRM